MGLPVYLQIPREALTWREKEGGEVYGQRGVDGGSLSQSGGSTDLQLRADFNGERPHWSRLCHRLAIGPHKAKSQLNGCVRPVPWNIYLHRNRRWAWAGACQTPTATADVQLSLCHHGVVAEQHHHPHKAVA